MSNFLDLPKVIDKVEQLSMYYTKSIFGYSNQLNSNRLRLILNRPKERHTIWVILKTLKKYKEHFRKELDLFRKKDSKY